MEESTREVVELRTKVQTLEHGQKRQSKLTLQQRRSVKSLQLCSVSALVVVSAVLWFSLSDIKVAPQTVETAVNRCFDILEEVTNKDMQEKAKLRQEVAEIKKKAAELQQEFNKLRNSTQTNEATIRWKQSEETSATPGLDKQDEAAAKMGVTGMKHQIGGADELRYEYETPRETAGEQQRSEFHSQITSKMEEYRAELVDIRIKIRVLEERNWMGRTRSTDLEQIVPRELLWSLAILIVVVLVIAFPVLSMHNQTFVNKLSQFTKKQEANMDHLVGKIDAQRGKLDQLTEKQDADRKNFEQETNTQTGKMDQLTKKQETDREQFVQELDTQRGITDRLSEKHVADRELFMQEIDAQTRKMDLLTKKQERDEERLVREITEVRNEVQGSRAVLLEPKAPHVIPFQTTMPDFFQHRTASDSWCSEPFYTHSRGYKMCLVVHANGVGDSEGKGVSAFIYLMRGDFDDELVWPFQGNVTISLLNQFEDSGHREITLSFKQHGERVINGETAVSGPGDESLVSYRDLSYVSDLHTQYLKHDSLRFRVSKVELNDNSAAVPVGVVMTDFEGRKKSTKGLFRASEKWFSEPFYTHQGGYKMCLSVVTNGCGDGQSTHVSIYVYLMRGEHDEQLKWPFCGTVTIQLLNRKSEGEHLEKTVEIYARRVMFWHERATCGRGHTKFIAHTELCTQDKEYVQNDSLKFQISKVVINSA